LLPAPAGGFVFTGIRNERGGSSPVIGCIRLLHDGGKSRKRHHRTATASLAAAVLAVALPAAALPAQASTGQWALDYLKAAQAWQVTKGAGVTVAVIDTGVTPVPDLRPNLLTGHDFVLGSTSPDTGQVNTDPEEHGTEIASLIAGTGIHVAGLAPQAKILPVRDLLENKLGGGGDIGAEAIRYAIAQHAGVINISQGGWTRSPDEMAALAAAERAGIVVVAAAGNESSSVDYPAAAPGVVAVTATDQNGKLAFFSNRGPQVSLAAPGVNVYADNNLDRQIPVEGTSMACAYVSATAALVRAAHPTWTAGQVIQDLIDTTVPGAGQAPGQHDDRYGYGIVDPLKALTAPAPAQTANPLPGATGLQAMAKPTPTVNIAAPLPMPTPQRVSAVRRIALGAVFLGIPLAIVAGAVVLMVAVRRRHRALRR
jgi:type VII secretion-associated serine protease mycosin